MNELCSFKTDLSVSYCDQCDECDVVIIGRVSECWYDRWGKLSTSSGISRLEITGLVRPRPHIKTDKAGDEMEEDWQVDIRYGHGIQDCYYGSPWQGCGYITTTTPTFCQDENYHLYSLQWQSASWICQAIYAHCLSSPMLLVQWLFFQTSNCGPIYCLFSQFQPGDVAVQFGVFCLPNVTQWREKINLPVIRIWMEGEGGVA